MLAAPVVKAIEHAVRAAMRHGEHAAALELLAVVTGGRDAATPEETPAPKSGAERARDYRARKQARTAEHGMTLRPVPTSRPCVTPERDTASRTRSDVPPFSLSHSPSSPETNSQDSGVFLSSSPDSSLLKQGSNLERRARESDAPESEQRIECDADGIPNRIDVTEAMRANCFAAGVPIPTPADALHFLSHYRKTPPKRRMPVHDWGSALVAWMASPIGRTQRANAARDKPVQANDPNAEWMADDYGTIGATTP